MTAKTFTTTSHPIATYMKPYFDYLSGSCGLAVDSILVYRDSLKLLFCFTADEYDKDVDTLLVEDLQEPVIIAFLNYLESTRHNCVKTRNLRLAGIRSFFGFLAREVPELIGLCNRVILIPKKKTPHHNADFLDDTEIKAVFKAVKSDDRFYARNKALLMFLYNTGARVGEVVGVRLSDLRLDDLGQVTLMGKGQKQRVCALWPQTVKEIENYLQVRSPQEPGTDALFLNVHGDPLTRAGVRYVVKKYSAIAEQACPTIGKKTISPHTFRHSIAMMLVRAGNDINMVQLFLGHTDINTTHAYFDLDMEMKRKVIDKITPPPTKKKPRWQKPKVLAFLNNLTKGGLTRSAQLC